MQAHQHRIREYRVGASSIDRFISRKTIEPYMCRNNVSQKVKTLIDSKESRLYVLVLCFLATVLFLCNSEAPVIPDEIAYFMNGAFLAGFPVDCPTSYHHGYSLLLSPVIWFFKDIDRIFYGIHVLNFFLWFLSFTIVLKIGDHLFPNVPERWRKAAFLPIIVYPGFLPASNYIFCSSLISFLYVSALLLLVQWNKIKNSHIYGSIFSLSIGAIYISHPVGIIPIIASTMVLSYRALKNKEWVQLLRHLVIVFFTCFPYAALIRPAFIESMTAPGFKPLLHYANYSIFGRLINEPTLVCKVFLIACGQLSYIVLGTFGIVLSWFFHALHRVLSKVDDSEDSQGEYNCSLMLILTLFGTVIAGSISLSHDAYTGLHYWFYGRYLEQFIVLPLYGGFLLPWSKMNGKVIIWFCPIVGILISAFRPEVTSIGTIVFSTALNPLLYYLITKTFDFSVPAIYLVRTSLICALPKNQWIKIIACCFFIGASAIFFTVHFNSNFPFHTPLMKIMEKRIEPSTVIGMQEKQYIKNAENCPVPIGDQILLYKYATRFYRNDFRRMTIDTWKSLKGSKFYLTAGPIDEFNEKQRTIVWDKGYNLYLIPGSDVRTFSKEQKGILERKYPSIAFINSCPQQ